MKKIRNDSIQAFELHLNTKVGDQVKFLLPKEIVVVPNGFISDQILNLAKRGHINITNC